MTSDPVITFFTALFLEPGAIDEAASLVRPEDFLQDDYRRAFRVMVALAENGKPIDVPHVCDKLQQCGMTEQMAVDLVVRLTDGDCLTGKIRDYAALVRKSSRKRRLMAAANAALTRVEAGIDPEEILGELQVDLWTLQSDRPASGPVSACDLAPRVISRLTARRNHVDDLAGLSTGIAELDDLTTGLRPGELWIAGALPGRGKTSFGTQVALRAASRGAPVLFFSIEMSDEELFERALGNQFGVWQIRTLHVSDKTFAAICGRVSELGTLPLSIDDPSNLTPIELASRARAAVRDRGIKLIVVDYLQLLRGPEREIRERVGNAANVLRQLAKETQVPVLALSQLRRPANLNDRPTMLDLKESGDIEAHANTVLLLYQPVANARPTGEDEIIVGKQRNGPLGTVPVLFDTRTLVFKPRSLVADRNVSAYSRTGERDD